MITVFTPSFADEGDTNAQNLSVKEIVPRLDPKRIHVTLLHQGDADPRIVARPNTKLITCHRHGNTIRALLQVLTRVPDIYFFPREGPLDATLLSFRRRLALKTAVVSYVVSGGLDNAPYSTLRQRHIRTADAVFANSQYLARLLNEKMGIVPSGVIYDGVDRRYYFEPKLAAKRADSLSVIYAGSFRAYKRVPLVIQQAARHPGTRFRLVGGGEEVQRCRDLASELHCNNVEFLGHLSSERLGEEMRQADIFFFPSILEGHPQVLLQAAACGLPSVAMNTYRPEYVIDGVTGFLVDDDQGLSLKLDLLIQDSDLRRKMGAAAAVHSRKFDWDAIAGQWQDAFEHVVALRQQLHAQRLQRLES